MTLIKNLKCSRTFIHINHVEPVVSYFEILHEDV